MNESMFDCVKPQKSSPSTKARQSQVAESLKSLLETNSIPYSIHAEGNHFRILLPKKFTYLNFYCSTGTVFEDGKSRYKGKGFDFLIELLHREDVL